VKRSFAARLAAVDAARLTPLVRAATGDGDAVVTHWNSTPLSGGYAGATVGGRGVYRFSGEARVGRDKKSWSLILKVLGRVRGVGSDDPVAWDYWQREILAYRSGLLDDLPGLASPRCFATEDHPTREVWLWLEDVAEGPGGAWTLSDYGAAARSLGKFNGAYLTGRPVPDLPWLTTGRVRSWLEMGRPIIERLEGFLAEAKRPHWLTPDQVERLLALWAVRGNLLQKLDRLPRVFCHHDAFCRNLFATGARTVAIDWQVVGTGAVGEEIVPLIGISLQFMDFAADRASELEAVVFEQYLSGLRASGWTGDERLVRFGYAASAALFVGVATVGCWPSIVDEYRDRNTEETIGASIPEIVAAWGVLQEHFLDLGDEALLLAEDVWGAA
jgi:Phosphotransferase enzyme family